MKKYAYIRVSSKDQNIARQVTAMQNIGILENDMYIDKQSGKDFHREQYQMLIKRLQSGDELYIKSIDRLGRDYDEIQEQWRYLTKKININIIVLDFPLLDTRNRVNGITGKFTVIFDSGLEKNFLYPVAFQMGMRIVTEEETGKEGQA